MVIIRHAISRPPNATNVGHFVDDEEIDFDRVLREETITLPEGVSWTAHWLALEGVQPLILDNAPAISKDVDQGITKSPPPGQTYGTNIPIDAAIRKSLYCQEATTAACHKCAVARATALLYAAHVVVITVHC